MTLTDIYYKCTGTKLVGTTSADGRVITKCTASDNTYVGNAVQIESSSTNNWTSPFTDTDPDDYWCTPANGSKYSIY